MKMSVVTNPEPDLREAEKGSANPHSTESWSVTAFYRFLPLTEAAIAQLHARLTARGKELGILGLILIGPEGCNGTVSGNEVSLPEFKREIRDALGAEDIEFKDSVSQRAPFRRLKVDIRAEIITFERGVRHEHYNSTADSAVSIADAATHLSPAEWHAAVTEDPDVVVVDTRNIYETAVGKFRGAVDPGLEKFSEWPEYVGRSALPKDKKILLYCTGGIRCEKAVLEMQQQGYQNVFQLSGGILKYLENFPNGAFDGECFVFDHRVAVDNNLQPSQRYRLCPHCGNPGSERITCGNCGTEAVICERCKSDETRISCSKNCAYHRRRLAGMVSKQRARAKRLRQSSKEVRS